MSDTFNDFSPISVRWESEPHSTDIILAGDAVRYINPYPYMGTLAGLNLMSAYTIRLLNTPSFAFSQDFRDALEGWYVLDRWYHEQKRANVIGDNRFGAEVHHQDWLSDTVSIAVSPEWNRWFRDTLLQLVESTRLRIEYAYEPDYDAAWWVFRIALKLSAAIYKTRGEKNQIDLIAPILLDTQKQLYRYLHHDSVRAGALSLVLVHQDEGLGHCQTRPPIFRMLTGTDLDFIKLLKDSIRAAVGIRAESEHHNPRIGCATKKRDSGNVSGEEE